MTRIAENAYPDPAAERDRWVLARRGPRAATDSDCVKALPARRVRAAGLQELEQNAHLVGPEPPPGAPLGEFSHSLDPRRAQGVFTEVEAADCQGRLVRVLTVLLTSSECPWRCVMCDLWRHTQPGPMPPGAIPEQLAAALRQAGSPASLPPVIKLYNSGSFFDPRAVPPEDYAPISELLRPFNRVVVECHPKLVGARVTRFQATLRRRADPPPRLEVALGLETAEPAVLEQLNKRMTLDDFRRAAAFLRAHEVDLRVFVLVQPPFMAPPMAVDWAVRSAAFAFAQGATAVSLIPTRTGNGALEALAKQGRFAEPTLEQLEAALAGAWELNRGRVFADLWDLERFSQCDQCFAARRDRLDRMNRTQRPEPAVVCKSCGPGK